MVKVPQNWERRLVELAAIHGVTDFLLRGRLTKAESKVFYTILNKIGKPAARQTAGTVARAGGTAVRVGKTIALRHPVLTAAYYTYKNRDEIADLVEQGYEIVQPAVDPVVQPVTKFLREEVLTRENLERARDRGVIDTPTFLPEFIEQYRPSRRKKSKYNRAVSAAMKAIKRSTKGGKKGTISSPKSVFRTVSKAVSKVNRGLRAPTKGIGGIAARAARKIIGKKSKKPKKRGRGYTLKVN